MRGRRALAGCVVVLAGCASSAGSADPSADLPASVEEPYVVMTSATDGVLVWQSGDAWVLLSTRDGFAHVTNRTPIGVDTGGGLTVAATSQHYAVAIGAHERLRRSPLLTAGTSWRWQPDELPGAVSGARGAVAIDGAGLTAVVRADGGTLARRTKPGWATVVRGSRLGGPVLDSVQWDRRTGWLTGHGKTGTAKAYQTVDAGGHWTPIGASRDASAALTPCGAGAAWTLPLVRTDGGFTVLRTSDAGAHWTPGGVVPDVGQHPAWGCSGRQVWAAGGLHGTAHLFASADSGAHWTDRGPAPDDLADLAPVGSGTGFATSGGSHPQLWRVSDDGGRFTAIRLPGWVATLGGAGGSD